MTNPSDATYYTVNALHTFDILSTHYDPACSPAICAGSPLRSRSSDQEAPCASLRALRFKGFKCQRQFFGRRFEQFLQRCPVVDDQFSTVNGAADLDIDGLLRREMRTVSLDCDDQRIDCAALEHANGRRSHRRPFGVIDRRCYAVLRRHRGGARDRQVLNLAQCRAAHLRQGSGRGRAQLKLGRGATTRRQPPVPQSGGRSTRDRGVARAPISTAQGHIRRCGCDGRTAHRIDCRQTPRPWPSVLSYRSMPTTTSG